MQQAVIGSTDATLELCLICVVARKSNAAEQQKNQLMQHYDRFKHAMRQSCARLAVDRLAGGPSLAVDRLLIPWIQN
jgi:hypothetical protein